MLVSHSVVRRPDDPFTGHAYQQVGSTLTREPIKRSRRVMSTCLPGSSTNQHRRRERDVMYTSRGSSFRLRERIRQQRVNHGLTSELDHDDRTPDGEHQSTCTIIGVLSTDNRASMNCGDRHSTMSSKHAESLRCDHDRTPTWLHNQHPQKTVSK